MSNLVPAKVLKTAEHSNSYFIISFSAKRRNLLNIYLEIVGKNPEMDKSEKMIIRVQFVVS